VSPGNAHAPLLDAVGFHHIGVPVASLERSLAFYRELFGIEPDFVAESSGPETARLVRVEGAELTYAFLTVGRDVLELLEYHTPTGRPFTGRNCDVGAVHIAFEVPDVDAAHAALVERGVEVSGPPVKTDGPLEGCATIYFTDPDGIQLEAFERPPADAP